MKQLVVHSALALSLAAIAGGAKASAQSVTSGLADLPLKEVRAAAKVPPDSVFAIFITGDGGWANIDNDVTAELAAHGINVVGLDSRSYLHNARTPERVAEDISRIARAYQRAWHIRRFALIGYSRGADLSPFIVNRMDSTLRGALVLVGMLGLGERAGFEFHFQDIFRDVKRPTDRLTLPEVERLRGVRMLCVYGAEEEHSGCRSAPEGLMEKVQRPGSHHFDSDYKLLGSLLVAALHRP